MGGGSCIFRFEEFAPGDFWESGRRHAFKKFERRFLVGTHDGADSDWVELPESVVWAGEIGPQYYISLAAIGRGAAKLGQVDEVWLEVQVDVGSGFVGLAPRCRVELIDGGVAIEGRVVMSAGEIHSIFPSGPWLREVAIPIDFQSAHWIEQPKSRSRMLGSLLGTIPLIGFEEDELVSLLGPPRRYKLGRLPWKDWQYCYEVGSTLFDSIWLLLRVDSGRVAAARLFVD